MTAETTVKKARTPRAKSVKKTDDVSVAPAPRAKKADAVHRLRIKVRAYEHGETGHPPNAVVQRLYAVRPAVG